MRKMLLFILALLVSFNSFAADSSLNQAIVKSINKQSENNANKNTLIYGGKDMSHPVIATADESVWSGSHTFIG